MNWIHIESLGYRCYLPKLAGQSNLTEQSFLVLQTALKLDSIFAPVNFSSWKLHLNELMRTVNQEPDEPQHLFFISLSDFSYASFVDMDSYLNLMFPATLHTCLFLRLVQQSIQRSFKAPQKKQQNPSFGVLSSLKHQGRDSSWVFQLCTTTLSLAFSKLLDYFDELF